MTQAPAVTGVAQLISLSLAPAFLIVGIGSMLNVMAQRLARVVDRARVVEGRFADPAAADRARWGGELRVLDRRMGVVQLAVGCGTASALFVCLVVAILFLSALTGIAYARPIAVLFIVAMALLIAGLMLFLWEVNLAMHSVRIDRRLLDEARGGDS